MPNRTTHRRGFADTVSDVLMILLYMSFITLETDVTGVYIMIGLIATIFVINIVRRPNLSLHTGRFHLYMLLFALFSLASSMWAINADYAIENGITILELLAAFSLLYGAYYNADIERLLKIMMWAGFILGLYTIMFYGVDALEDTLQSEGRLDNAFANVNTIGMACCKSVVIALYLFRQKRNYIHLLFCLPSIIIIAGSGSRKALVMLILGLLFVFLYQNREKKKSKKFLKIIGSLLILSIIVYAGISSGIFAGSMARMDGLIASFTGEGEVDHSSYLRELYRLLGFQQFLDTPILGIGMGNARILALSATGHDCYLHCNYAELAANGGIIGLILYYWIYIPIIRKEFRARKIDSYAPAILFLVFLQLLMDYGAVSYFSKQTYFLLMVVMLHLDKLKNLKLTE